MSFLDSPTKDLQKSLDETVASILAPEVPDRSLEYVPDTSDPSRLGIRSAVRSFLENKDMDVEAVALQLTSGHVAQPQSPTRPPWDRIEERVNERLGALISETHRDLVREKQRIQNEALMRESLDVSQHAKQVRETKEAYNQYLSETQELTQVVSEMDALDENIRNLEVSLTEMQAAQTHKNDQLMALREDDAEANRLVARMWELDSEERAAKLGMRGDMSEAEAVELAELRETVGTNLEENERIRHQAIKKAQSALTDLGHRIGFSQREHGANKVARSV
eukprot:CAMPEP_0173403044 /NCGR_PEP_ID=MMETSP1356-20130122/55674_1 /TAXON_ID=77927 ORGANISM="Hemiselmis virescens, Strain PCC157" /NCGR_SAMPLE_ID=MMETSP1356 /ASSEMBLY_ACC=CAM_ASM_000847 /LENGTH=279 /DNA_ID=CAMNT_0014363507 /DNA_START=129 /DNA_END=965 /DNA_ORIENTATION=-